MAKERIAVIGSGVGAMTAIYGVTQTPNWQDKYEITVYQMGWRSGGKGASGRNAQFGQRIEEHGLHVWAGFYDNAFRMMGACYDELVTLGLRKPEDPLGTMATAFKPLSHIFLAEHVEQSWRPWILDLPTNDVPPGSRTTVPRPFEMFLNILKICVEFLKDGELDEPAINGMDLSAPSGLHVLHEAIHRTAQSLPQDPKLHDGDDLSAIAKLIKDAQDAIHALQTPKNIDNDPLRRALYLMDLAMAFAYGMVTTQTFVKGYDILDKVEFSDFLRANGASEAAVSWVAVRGCYDFVFGFEVGDTNSAGNVGAGTALRAMSRLLFTYSTAIFHKMQAGMGDTIFGPYYQVLRAKGVRFKYFNAATNLGLSADKSQIEHLDMVEQAAVSGGDYDPLVDVEGLPCWPSAPLWDQLVDGDKLKASGIDFECEKTPPIGRAYQLKRGVDFDTVVLGASIGSLQYLTPELQSASPRWRNMLKTVKTVGTHATQLWLSKSAAQLGWDQQVKEHNAARSIPTPPLRTIITGLAEPLDTWADMSHLLKREAWGGKGPQSLAYFCAPAPDGETLDGFEQAVDHWADQHLSAIWPKSVEQGKFETQILYPQDPKGFASQYRRVNMYGSERYVLSVTGSVFHRLKPGESGFSNLYLAGDWTVCGLNAGCVEAATISGIAAASALTRQPLLNVGATDLDPDKSAPEQAMFKSSLVSGANWPLTGFYARGDMTGWFAFYAMPRAQVQNLLPQGIELSRDPLAADGFHTVGASFCRFHNVRGSFAPNFMAMRPYGEATFAIPFTKTQRADGAQFYYPKCLYVNNRRAIFDGKFYYSMPKNWAEVEMTEQSFSAENSAGLKMKAEFLQIEDAVALVNHAALPEISAILNENFITQSRRGHQYFNAFNLSLDRCHVAPVRGNISVLDPSEDGFPNIDQVVGPLVNHAGSGIPGAFRIWSSWSLTNPLDSKRVMQASMAARFLQP